MEPARLWRQERVDAGGVRYVRFVYSPYEGGSEWTTVDLPMAALPRAEYDALVKERDEAKASAAAAGRLLDEHRNGCVWMTWHKEAEDRANAATARAEKAEALLREARVAIMYSGLAARIDALLDAPTPDDRRGEDGAWIKP